MTNMSDEMSDKDRQLIYTSKIFKGVNVENLGHLLSECELLDIASGTNLIHANTKNESFYVVLTGSLGVYLDTVIDEQFVALHPGDCVGELSIYDGGRTSAEVVATSDSRLLKIRDETLWRLVRASHGFARNLLYIQAKRMRNNNVAIVNGLHQQQELEHIANVDALTGLFNRRWMNEFFKRQITRALKDNRPVTLLLADVDNFKLVNDTHGHIAGDEVLSVLASMLTQLIRPSDLLARFGGEEFAMILPDTSIDEARHIAERMRTTIDAMRIKIENEASREIHVTLSLGVTSLRLGDKINDLLSRADQALYLAKKNGRNRVEVG